MRTLGQDVLKLLSVTVAVLFALGVMLTAANLFFFGSSKVRPLFGLSADALAGDPVLPDGGPRQVRPGRPDASF